MAGFGWLMLAICSGFLMDGWNALRDSHGGSRLQKRCPNGTGIIALVTLSARASWYTLMDASVIIGTPADTSKQTGKIGGKGGPASLHAVCIYVVFFQPIVLNDIWYYLPGIDSFAS